MENQGNNEDIFKKGTAEDLAQLASQELQKSRPEQSAQETDEEVLAYITGEIEKGVPLDEIVIDLVGLITQDKARQVAILQQARAKIERTVDTGTRELNQT